MPRRSATASQRIRRRCRGSWPAGAGRHRGRHRAECAEGLRRGVRRARWRSSPGCPSSPRRTSSRRWPRHDAMVERIGRAEVAGRVALSKIANDIRLLGLGPALRPRRAGPARERARLLDHAGQGEPDPVRGDDDGLRPGHGQRRRRHRRRRHGPLRAQRLQAGHHLQRPAIDRPARRRLPQLHRQLRRRHRGRSRADQPTC